MTPHIRFQVELFIESSDFPPLSLSLNIHHVSSRNRHLVSLLVHTNLTSKYPHITLLSDMGPQKHNNEILRDQSKSESAFFFSIYLLYFEGPRNKSCMMSSLMHHCLESDTLPINHSEGIKKELFCPLNYACHK